MNQRLFSLLFTAGVLSSLMTSSPLSSAARLKFLLTPQSETTYQLPVNDVVTVEYEVTNQTKVTRTLTTIPIQGVTHIHTKPGSCSSPFTLGHNESCLLELEIRGAEVSSEGIHEGPRVCKTKGPDSNSPNGFLCSQPATENQLNITVVPVPPLTSLTVSNSELILAQQGVISLSSGAGFAASKARQLLITNAGAAVAQDVGISSTPDLPAGTSITPANCGDIAPGGTCTLTITPGNNPSTVPAQPNGTAPTPSLLTIQGSNTNTVTSDIIILTYGNLIEGGLVYDIDDTTPVTQSVAGKVVTGKNDEFNATWNEALTAVITPLAENTGAANTTQIIAAGNCTTEAGCAAFGCRSLGSDWYLPAQGDLNLVRAQLCPSTIDCNFGDFIDNGIYWTSSQQNPTGFYPYVVIFPDGVPTTWDYNVVHSVRCTRDFTF